MPAAAKSHRARSRGPPTKSSDAASYVAAVRGVARKYFAAHVPHAWFVATCTFHVVLNPKQDSQASADEALEALCRHNAYVMAWMDLARSFPDRVLEHERPRAHSLTLSRLPAENEPATITKYWLATFSFTVRDSNEEGMTWPRHETCVRTRRSLESSELLSIVFAEARCRLGFVHCNGWWCARAHAANEPHQPISYEENMRAANIVRTRTCREVVFE